MKNKLVYLTIALFSIFIVSNSVSAASVDFGQMTTTERSEYLRASSGGSTFVVNNTGTSGDANPGDETCETASGNGICTLQAAIEEADDDGDHDIIQFNLPNPSTITANYGIINTPVTIDGSTNPGASCPTTTSPAILPVTIDGWGITLYWNADGSVIRGLNLVNADNGISMTGQDVSPGGTVNNITDVVIQCNHIGTDGQNTDSIGNEFGILIREGTRDITIGGSNVTERNVISGNFLDGIRLGVVSGGGTFGDGDSMGSVSILGNYIGVGVDGTTVLGNGQNGIWGDYDFPLSNSHDYTDIKDNTIAFNGQSGFSINDGRRNGQILVENNTINNNGSAGVERRDVSDEGMILTLTENNIYGNDFLGIDKDEVGVSLPETDSKNNFPLLIDLDGNNLEFSFEVDFDNGDEYRMEVFHSDSCDSSGYGEGQTYVEFFMLTPTSASADYSRFLGGTLPAGKFLTMTATNPDGETSEFSNCIEEANGFVVNNNGDGSDTNHGNGICATSLGVCTLRAAIQEINANNSADSFTISFSVPLNQTISPQSQFPPIGKRVTIDGTTQSGATCEGAGGYPVPIININGALAGGTSTGFILGNGSDGSVIKGLNIYNFGLDGILVGSDNNRIECNQIGQAAVGGFGNGDDGIEILTNNNTVGGTEIWRTNVLANNNGAGVEIGDDANGNGASGNHILGNQIGVFGTSPAGNGTGVLVNDSAENNTIGTTNSLGDITRFNVIGYNTGDGVRVDGTGWNNAVLGNYIGIATNGTTNIANGGDGIDAGATFTKIGTTTSSFGFTVNVPNYVGNSPRTGIFVAGNSTTVYGNFVGVSSVESAEHENDDYGIYITGGSGTVEANTVGHSGLDGIRIQGSSGNAIGNYVGVRKSGTDDIGNLRRGISMTGSSADVEGNYVGNSTSDGIHSTVSGVTIVGNFVGVYADGATPAPNSLSGIALFNDQATVGSINDETATNLVANNTIHGIYVAGDNALVANNIIRDNGGDGITVTDSADDNHFRSNSIFDNGNLAIDLKSDNILNADGDSGNSNDMVNRPIIVSAEAATGQINFSYSADTSSVQIFYVEFFSNPDCSRREGQTPLTFTSFTTNSSGDFTGTLNVGGFFANQGITAIVSNRVSTAPASTSEFSDCEVAFGTIPTTNLFVNTADDVVDSLGCDDDHCSLREAINAANALDDTNTINFKQPFTINLTNALPEITKPVIIDGVTGTGASCPTNFVPANLTVAIIGDEPFIGLNFSAPGEGGASGSQVFGLQLGGFTTAISGSSVSDFFIFCNQIGVVNNNPVPNYTGIALYNSKDSLIGGSNASDRNVISGNYLNGIFLASGPIDGSDNDITVDNNYIGTSTDGSECLGNGLSNIALAFVSVITIGSNPNDRNTIACSGTGSGIHLNFGTIEVRMRYNDIFANSELGIDLNNDNVTLNDSGDGDSGGNELMNFPELLDADMSGFVKGELDSAFGTYTIDLYQSDSCDDSGYGEGEDWVDSFFLTINGANDEGRFTETLSAPSGSYAYLTMTATDSNNNTSEFSECFVVGMVPAAVAMAEQSTSSSEGSIAVFVSVLGLAILTALANWKGKLKFGSKMSG